MKMSKAKLRERVFGNSGVRNPTDNELKRLLYWAREGRNPDRNEAIFFMLLVGFRVSEVARVTVDMLMWPSGEWRDIVQLPSDMAKNNHANQILFVTKRMREALDQYVERRITKRQRCTDKPDEYRGLQGNSQFILSETGKGYSLKRKARKNVNDEEVEYWTADTLQAEVTKWCEKAGLSELSSHFGRKAFASRLAKNKATSSEEIIATLLRHDNQEQIYTYVDESEKVYSNLAEFYKKL